MTFSGFCMWKHINWQLGTNKKMLSNEKFCGVEVKASKKIIRTDSLFPKIKNMLISGNRMVCLV